MENHYIKCSRKLDSRTIYVKSECLLSVWVDVIFVLIDCDFEITKITEKKYQQTQAKSKWHYSVTDKGSSNFISFLEENHQKTLKIINKKAIK